MKLLIITSRVPWPLDKGDKLRIYHQIRYLSKSFDVELIALSSDKNTEKDAYSELIKYCHKIHFISLSKTSIALGVLKSFFNGLPLQLGYFYNKSIDNEIESIILKSKPDFIYGQLVRVAEYMKNSSLPKVLDLQDALSAGLKRRSEKSKGLFKLILKMEYKRMLAYEKNRLLDFTALSIITQADKDLLPEEIMNKTEIVPNGVDFNFFKEQNIPDEFEIVFTGNMAYPPNVLAASFLVKSIMPIVWESIPKARVLLAGASPHASVLDLANSRVEVSGWIDDIRDAYAKASVFVAPMQIGTGLQNKLLEAMAMKLPCVTSELANKALKAENNKQILIASDNDEQMYADSIIRLLTEKDFSKNIAEQGHGFVIKNYDWQSAVDRLKALFEK